MAMIKCIECGKEFSDRADACPNCGCPTSDTTGKKKESNVSVIAPLKGPSSEEATKKMKDAVAAAKRTASSADSSFDWENSKIQRMASSSIGLFDNDAVTRVADISMAAKKACDDLYAALQMALATLDRTCRPLLASKPDGTAIKEVYDEIKQLNSDSEISNTFTASFNYNNLGDVATRRYSPSLEAKMIENFWKSEYDKIRKDMDRIASERRAKEEAARKQAAEKKQREEAAFQAANKDKIDAYALKVKKSIPLLSDLEKKAFEKKKAEATNNRKAEKEKAEAAILKNAQEKTAAIQKERSGVDCDYVKAVTSLRAELEEKQALLPTLGLFKFSEKKALNSKIEEMVYQLQSMAEGYRKKSAQLEKKVADCEEEKQKSIKKEYEAIEMRFPMPEMVKKEAALPAKVVSQNDNLTAVQMANEAVKDAIYEYLLGAGLQTIPEIMENCPETCDLTNQRVSALTRQLLTDGRVERIEEKRKAYFRAVEGYSKKKKAIPETKKNPMGAIEELVKSKPISFSQIKVDGKNSKALEDYEKYGYLKLLAIDGKIYCEESGNDLTVSYIPEEYRKKN